MSSTADLQLLPGYRFDPTDEELVNHYLRWKCQSPSTSFPMIAAIELYHYNPWDLPGLALDGDKEWYFFTQRDRKYKNGSRPNRAAGSGYWKASGGEKSIGHPKPVGSKRALMFKIGKQPGGEKTNWLMDEYCLTAVDRSTEKKKGQWQDDWVLCRVHNKKGPVAAELQLRQQQTTSRNMSSGSEFQQRMPENLTCPPHPAAVDPTFDTSYSVPMLHAESSCSENVVLPEFTGEVESEDLWDELEKALGLSYNYMDATVGNGVPENLTCLPPQAAVAPTFYTSDSVPRLQAKSSFSEHVVPPEFTWEAQSDTKQEKWENALAFQYNYMDGTVQNGGGWQLQSSNQMPTLQGNFTRAVQNAFWDPRVNSDR